MAKNASVGIKIATQRSKGAPKVDHMEAKGVKNNPQCPYTNPSKAQAKGMEHKVGKLG